MENLTQDEIDEMIDVLEEKVVRLERTIEKLYNVLISKTNQEQKIHSE